jgi:uncharacterized protein
MVRNVKALTLAEIKELDQVKAYIEQADEFMMRYGYTEHGFRHAGLVSDLTGEILKVLGFNERTVEMGRISGYLHDVGNVICRQNHEMMGALLAERILVDAGMDYTETALIMNAIGNHEEDSGWAASDIGAAVIIADKADVHQSRVRDQDQLTYDIHGRVNFASKRSALLVSAEKRIITLEIDIDTGQSEVMEYFEIFLSRMEMCQKAASFLNARFSLVINGVKLL